MLCFFLAKQACNAFIENKQSRVAACCDPTMGAEQNCRLPGRTEARPYDRMMFSAMYYVENEQSRVAACCDLPGDSFSFCKVSDLACHHTHRYVITTEHLRSSLSNLLIFLTLSLSEAEREVYHNQTVSDGHIPLPYLRHGRGCIVALPVIPVASRRMIAECSSSVRRR